MLGVSEVIAIILILMITISLAGLAYMFMSTTMSDVTASAGSTVDTTISSMLTTFRIETIDVAKVYVRNTGQNALTDLSVYVNDEPAIYNVTPSIGAGQIGTITIYSFIPDGATVKVTSSSGFSASKVARPCDKAVLCMSFNENGGSVSHDSSPYGNDGTISEASWTSGIYGSGLVFDGVNDHVNITSSSSLQFENEVTVEAIVYPRAVIGAYIFVQGSINGLWQASFVLSCNTGVPEFIINGHKITGSTISTNTWQRFVGIYNGTHKKLYKNGELIGISAETGSIINENGVKIGGEGGGNYPFNGTIDEVRIYSRAIY